MMLSLSLPLPFPVSPPYTPCILLVALSGTLPFSLTVSGSDISLTARNQHHGEGWWRSGVYGGAGSSERPCGEAVPREGKGAPAEPSEPQSERTPLDVTHTRHCRVCLSVSVRTHRPGV